MKTDLAGDELAAGVYTKEYGAYEMDFCRKLREES